MVMKACFSREEHDFITIKYMIYIIYQFNQNPSLNVSCIFLYMSKISIVPCLSKMSADFVDPRDLIDPIEHRLLVFFTRSWPCETLHPLSFSLYKNLKFIFHRKFKKITGSG